MPPIPLSLTFDMNGGITGRCDYTAPASTFSRQRIWNQTLYEWKTRFTLTGKVDWQTGKIELTIPDSRTESYYQKDASALILRTEHTTELTAKLSARHTADPYWSQKIPPQMAQFLGEDKGLPNLTTNSKGLAALSDYGWFGHRTLDPEMALADLQSNYKEVSRDHLPGFAPVMKIVQEYASKPNWGPWYLRLIGPDTTERELGESELAGTSIWPDRNTNVAVGERVNVQFVGVFSNNATSLRDLTNIADWQIPAGVQQVQPGVFVATKPGQFEVRARAKGKSGQWMEGFVTIVATGK